MGTTWFKLGEPKPPNMAARERVEALTIYDSTSNQETQLAYDVVHVQAGSRPAVIFAIGMTVLFLATLVKFGVFGG